MTAAGSTDPLASLQKAFADDPGQIMLVTAKAGDLDDSLADQVAKLRGSSTAKIDCFAVNGVPGDKVYGQDRRSIRRQIRRPPRSTTQSLLFLNRAGLNTSPGQAVVQPQMLNLLGRRPACSAYSEAQEYPPRPIHSFFNSPRIVQLI